MLYSRAAVLFGIEVTPGTAVAVTPAADAMLVDEPDYTADVQTIERNFSKGDLSPFPFMVGRKLGQLSFKHEVRGNGKATGLVADAPKLARLFRACGFQLAAASTNAERVSPVYPDLANVGAATWAVGGNATITQPVMYELRCTTGGAAAAAQFTITANNAAVSAAPVANVAANAAMALPGSGGLTVTPTVQANFAVGDTFRVMVLPLGVRLIPVSEGYETATIEAFFDGLKHRLTGAVGTFSFSADAGGVATVEFTFWGVHNTVVDAAFPNGLVFENTLPPLFQNALVTWGSNAGLIIGSLSFDLSLEAAPREDANHEKGYRGYQLQSRAPSGGFTPEATTEAQHAFWGDYEAATQKFFMARVGDTVGNSLVFYGSRVQTSALGYTDRNNNRAYDVGMKFARYQGNDEVQFYFC